MNPIQASLTMELLEAKREEYLKLSQRSMKLLERIATELETQRSIKMPAKTIVEISGGLIDEAITWLKAKRDLEKKR